MAFPKQEKDPDAVLDYTHDWSQWLGDDIIVDSQWLVGNPDGATEVTVHASNFEDTKAHVWLSGGQAGKKYIITNRITTRDGRIDDRSFELRVKHT